MARTIDDIKAIVMWTPVIDPADGKGTRGVVMEETFYSLSETIGFLKNTLCLAPSDAMVMVGNAIALGDKLECVFKSPLSPARIGTSLSVEEACSDKFTWIGSIHMSISIS